MSGTRENLRARGFRFKKQFGQNFITDTNLLDSIAGDAGIGKEDTVVEVGAGAGTLTAALARRANKVIAYEIDRDLKPVLEEAFLETENVEFVFEDVLKHPLEALFEKTGGPYKVVANLPYYITAPVMMRFLDCEDPPESMSVMVQKEVAERITAKPDTAEYGVFTLMVALFGDAEIKRQVPRGLFYPVPAVDSALVHIVKNIRFQKAEADRIRKVVKAAFSMRRKTLKNNLNARFGVDKDALAEIIRALGYPEEVRGEVLSLDDYARLAEKLHQANPNF